MLLGVACSGAEASFIIDVFLFSVFYLCLSYSLAALSNDISPDVVFLNIYCALLLNTLTPEPLFKRKNAYSFSGLIFYYLKTNEDLSKLMLLVTLIMSSFL